MKVLYTTQATATGGRDGKAATKDGSFQVTLATPKELGGGGGPGNNPEQLFAAGYSACFIGAMKAVAGKQGITLPEDLSVDAEVDLVAMVRPGRPQEGDHGGEDPRDLRTALDL